MTQLKKKLPNYVILVLTLVLFRTVFIPVSSQQLTTYKMTFVVSTTSDWTSLSFFNLTLLSSNYSIVLGENAPQLSYSVSSNQITIHKKQFDETNVTIKFYVTFSIEGKPSLLIEKGDIGSTALKIYDKSGKEIFSAVSVSHVSNDTSGLNPRSFYLPSLENFELSKEEANLSKVLSRQLVLAFYYPWYGNPQSNEGSGILTHWEKIEYNSIGSSTYYPLLGPYDSQDERVIEAHIEMAKVSGIDGFICSWWGIGTFEDDAFKKILKVASKENFSVTIYYESVRDITQDQIVDELSYILSSYSSEPSFLKINGKPTVFVYAVSAYNRNSKFWNEVISKVKEKTKVDAIFIADSFDMSYFDVFDGFHTYNPIWISRKNFYNVYSSEAKVIRVNGKIWAATVCPGYDDRKIRKPGNYVNREDGAYYNLTWNASVESNPDIVLICTFNEWHEGTNIEPSREFGFKYLQLTKYWVEKYKNTSFIQQETPAIKLSFQNNELTLSNNGKGDAIAVNLLVTQRDLNKNFNVWSYKGNAYVLPVNSTTISLWIPLIKENDNVKVSLPFLGPGDFSVRLCYYSLSGEAFTENITYSSSIKSTTGLNFSILALASFVILIIMVLLIYKVLVYRWRTLSQHSFTKLVFLTFSKIGES
ncbi:MAG: hypothetical protein HA495_08025 [Thaumarchaeota archaeon]|nr:hypothetical protein [Nitrososphaerota archaeon]